MNWFCMPLPVERAQLREAVLGLRALGFAGAAVSQPYQSKVLDFLDGVTPSARAIGAVQYIELEEGRLLGFDLSWSAFLATLRRFKTSLRDLRPLVIGADDAACSVVFALTHEGLPLTVVDENMSRAIDLVHRLRHVMDEHSFSVYRWPQDAEWVASNANLIINTTGFCDRPNARRCPWPDGISFPPDALVVDLAPTPDDTHFIRQAKVSGARTVGGLHLMVQETASAIERWTGYRPSSEVLWRVAKAAVLRQMRGAVAIPAVENDQTGVLDVAAQITT
jgi:shikimate dehydrogenase